MTEIFKPAIPWQELAETIVGEVETDHLHRVLYATDASVYRTLPVAVVYPKQKSDIQSVVRFASKYQLSITPRAGGTSLAGQAVGDGVIVDVSRYLVNILEINVAEGWVRVEPGVIRDELNAVLRPLGYWFGPNTSTANRCTLGGMLGNNSCGTTSISVGSTRDHTLEVHCILSDGSEAVFGALDWTRKGKKSDFNVAKSLSKEPGRLGAIYHHLFSLLENEATREEIVNAFPRPDIERRNTGYALDLLARQFPFEPYGPPFNLATLLAGSEGTLAFTTEIKLRILPLPPAGRAVAALHFPSVSTCMQAVAPVMQYEPFLCELMDRLILDAARQNRDQLENSRFIQGNPGALLLVEFRAATDELAAQQATQLGAKIEANLDCYATTVLSGATTERVWTLRSAGLGVLSNLPGKAKAVACIEDTAVALEDLANYIEEFTALMATYGQEAVYYAHAGAGEIHLRPILDLKASEDRQLFHDITRDVALLVKKYRGSLSGEHGDGRVRASFIPLMLGDGMYQRLRDLKHVFDPQNLFNPGKIVDAPPMNESLRYEADQPTLDYTTVLDFSEHGGLLELAEKCNGSGDCRKVSGGVMCPSYRATRQEKDTTRGRANALREILTREHDNSPFTHPVLAEALDLCLSCKACTAECPSNVDMSSLKAEYLHQRHQVTGVPWRYRLFADIDKIYRLGSTWPALFNLGLQLAGNFKGLLGVAAERSLPTVAKQRLRSWYRSHEQRLTSGGRLVYFFGDEFTDLQDAHVGRAALELLAHLGYAPRWIEHAPSGRAHLSKGILDRAKNYADYNVTAFGSLVTEDAPLIGIEPSAILSFRDEYPKLLRGAAQENARRLAANTYTITGFLYREALVGRVTADHFNNRSASILLHSHCYEKALGSPEETAFLLSLPANYSVAQIPSGCCGMAGSFGYEAEHYTVSMQIGEETLFPAVRAGNDRIIVAPGTSCRHQILDGTGCKALHPVEVLWEAVH